MPELGKYADTVLSAYGVSLLLLVVLVLASMRASRKALKELEKVESRKNG